MLLALVIVLWLSIRKVSQNNGEHMDMHSIPIRPDIALKTQITATDIPHILSSYIGRIKVLSLDCFDTLLWRKTATPQDVFYHMQHKPLFRSLGVTAYQRMAAAQRAYRAKHLSHDNRQISLRDMYHFFTSLTEEQKALLAEEELQTEIELCYSFYPFIELIRQATAHGIKVVIVSDIYLNAKQLRTLLAAHLPHDVIKAISDIFCSLEFSTAKSENLFQHVIEKLGVAPQSVLHIGDHAIADFEAPKRLGMHALHFLQFNTKIPDFLRLQNSATALASFSHPAIFHEKTARYSPFRGIFSLHNPMPDHPIQSIGYMTFGPMLYAFARFISDELATLRQAKKKVKPFFLLRDAYLLSKACETYSGQTVGALARIRKFVAVAASFRTREDIDYYISGIAPQYYNIWVICEQLLLPPELIAKIIEAVKPAANQQDLFNQIIHQDSIMQLIFKNSAEVRERLKKYMLTEMQIEPGDTVVLIDTGYIGVTQDFLSRALKKELNIEIIGRYFISSHEPDRPESKALMTSTWCEHGLFEQSCTYKEGSVLGYTAEGKPIFDKIKLSDKQYQKVEALQQECIRFITDAKKFFSEIKNEPSYEILLK